MTLSVSWLPLFFRYGAFVFLRRWWVSSLEQSLDENIYSSSDRWPAILPLGLPTFQWNIHSIWLLFLDAYFVSNNDDLSLGALCKVLSPVLLLSSLPSSWLPSTSACDRKPPPLREVIERGLKQQLNKERRKIRIQKKKYLK